MFFLRTANRARVNQKVNGAQAESPTMLVVLSQATLGELWGESSCRAPGCGTSLAAALESDSARQVLVLI